MATIVDNGQNVIQRAFLPVRDDEVIDVGDLVWWDASVSSLRKASAFTYDTSDALTRQKFKKDFCGISLEAHRVGDKQRIIPVAVVCEADASIVSATLELGDCVAPDVDATPLIANQQMEKVADSSQCIGVALRRYSSAVTTARVLVEASYAGLKAATAYLDAQSLWIPHDAIGPNVGTINFITPNAAIAQQLFGGAVEILAVGWLEKVAVTADMTVQVVKNAATNLTALTVDSATAAIGRYIEQAETADINRKFGAGDKFGVTLASGGNDSTARGSLLIRYRKLS